MGLGRSLALPGLRLRVENPVQVCSWACPLTPDPSPPFRGRGEEFGFQLAVGSWQLAVGGDGRSFLSRDTGSATPRFCWERGAARTCLGTRFFRMRSTAWLGLHAVL